MSRAIILVLDSFGIGAAPDAKHFGDQGSNTFGHIAEACAKGACDNPPLRKGPLHLPNLARWGLGHAACISTGKFPPQWPEDIKPQALYGSAAEISRGKDTPSGHWEITGCPVEFDWGYFPNTIPCFPKDFTDRLIGEFNLPGILGNKHASGTEIIKELGETHIATGSPIFYTSADSVFQVAVHETHFGRDRLYSLCERAKELLLPLNIARVIARPFIGESKDTFRRTENRRDYTTPPPGKTLLDLAQAQGREVWSIGKIADIFAGRGITHSLKAKDNDGLFNSTLDAMERAVEGAVIFANFVDFDMLYGHRRDVPGYAAALEAFDCRLIELEKKLRANDLVVITADHGCDPTWKGTDHTRENVPVLFAGAIPYSGSIGQRKSFADIGQSLACHLGIGKLNFGEVCF